MSSLKSLAAELGEARQSAAQIVRWQAQIKQARGRRDALIRELIETGAYGVNELARDTGMSGAQISRIARGVTQGKEQR